MMKIVGIPAPAGLPSRFVSSLKKHEGESAQNNTKNLEYVLEYLVRFSEDKTNLLDDYYKTFRRKKFVGLFTTATVQIF